MDKNPQLQCQCTRCTALNKAPNPQDFQRVSQARHVNLDRLLAEYYSSDSATDTTADTIPNSNQIKSHTDEHNINHSA